MATDMRFDVSALDRASATFLKVAESVERLERKLKDLDRVKAEPTVKLDTKPAERDLRAFETKLQRTFRNLPKAKLEADVDGLTAAERKIDRLQSKLTSLSNASVRVDLDVADSSGLAALQAGLASLSDSSIRVDLDAAAARADITAIATQLATLADASIRVELDTGTAQAQVDALFVRLLDLEALSPVRLRVEVDDQATAQLAAIQSAADALAASTPTIGVDADTAAATAQLAALLAQLTALGAATTTVNVRLDTPTFLGQLARIQTELRALAGGDIEINVDTRRMMEALAAARVELAALQAMDASVVVDADIELARYRINELERELARIAGRQYTANIDVDKDGRVSARLLAIGAAALYAVPALGSLTASAATLGGSLASLVGLAPLFVGGLAAGGAAAATLKVGLKGVGDALKETDPKAFAEALKGLAPAAQQFARAVRDISPAWKSVQLDVQQRLFAGLGAEMQKLSGAYLPTMRSGLGGIADQFNLLGKDMVGFATSTKTIGDVDAIFRSTTSALQAARPAAVNLAAAFTDIAVVGTSMLPELASGFTNVTGRFREFIAQARESGQLREWIQGGLDTLQQLGSVAGNVGSILGSVFTAAKASGADFLTTLDRVTEGVADFMRSGEGQNAMVAFFTQSRAAIDALLPGLETLGRAAAQAVEAFSNTGGLQDAGRAFSDVADAVAPLIPALAELAGGALSALAAGASAAASALTPIVDGAVGLLGALGPVAPAVLGMIVAFKGLGFVSAAVASLGVRMAALAATAGAGAATYTRITGAFAAAGRAIPILGAAVVGLAFAYDGLTTSTSEAVDVMSQGGTAARNLLKELQAQEQGVNSNATALQKWAEPFDEWTKTNILGVATVKNVTAAMAEQRAEMSAVERAQQDLTTAQDAYDEALNKFPPSSAQVRDAAAALADAHQNLADANDDAGAAAQSHTDKIVAQADAMRSQVGSALAYEDAVRRTADAHKAAQDALSEHGAKSQEYQTSVTDLARAMDSQASAAAAQAKALGGAEAGAKAYATEILRATDVSTGPGRDAFIKIASAMDTAGLAALSSAAQMSGLKTEIITLPDGRTVTVVVGADRGKLDSVVSDLNSLSAMKFVGTVTIIGDGVPFRDGVMAAVTFANGQKGFVTLDGNDAPIRAKIGGTKYTIDATTGVMTIDGNPAPGDANLSGLKLRVDATTGQMTIEGDASSATSVIQGIIGLVNSAQGTLTINGDTVQATGAINSLMGLVNSSSGTININGNAQPAGQALQTVLAAIASGQGSVTINGQAVPAQQALQMILGQIDAGTGMVEINGQSLPAGQVLAALLSSVNGSTGTITVDGNTGLVDGKITATLTRADGSTGTITIDGNPTLADGKTTSAVAFADGSRGTITIDGNQTPADGKINATITYANGSTGIVKVDANASAANAAIDNAARNRTSTITVNYVYRNQAQQTSHLSQGGKGGAIGGIVTPMKDGGVLGFANGGVGVSLTPMSGSVAQVVPPNTWRVIGDRVTGDEFFIPDNEAPRSLKIGAEWARRRGMALVPAAGIRKMADGGMIRAEDGSMVPSSFYDKVSPQYRAANGGAPIRHGEISQSAWDNLKAKGWRGKAGDNQEALYHPDSFGGGGGGGALGGSFPMARLTVGFSMGKGGIVGTGGGLVQVKHGSIPASQWQQLRDMGYKGRPGDGAEAFYVPANVLRSVTHPSRLTSTGATQSGRSTTTALAALNSTRSMLGGRLDLGPLLKALMKLGTELRGTGGGVTFNNEFTVSSVAKAADAVARVQRAQSAMGMFSGR